SSEPWKDVLGARGPVSATSSAPKLPEVSKRLMVDGSNGLLKTATKPVEFGVKLLTAKPITAMLLLTPVIDVATVSVALTVWVPGKFNVAVKTPWPDDCVELAGRLAPGSLLVKWTVPL